MSHERLAAWMLKNDVSQEDLATRIGASQGYVSRLLSGKRAPGLDVAFAIERETNGYVAAKDWAAGPPPRHASRRTV